MDSRNTFAREQDRNEEVGTESRQQERRNDDRTQDVGLQVTQKGIIIVQGYNLGRGNTKKDG